LCCTKASPSNKKKRKEGVRGPKKGSKNRRSNLTRGDWYEACEEFTTTSTKWKSKKAFLLSDITSNKFQGSDSEVRSFGEWLKKFHAGTLKPSDGSSKRERKPDFPEVEAMLVGYIRSRKKKSEQGEDKVGISWQIMQEKALEYAEVLAELGVVQGVDQFRASSGWIANVLERNGLSALNEAGEKTSPPPRNAGPSGQRALLEFFETRQRPVRGRQQDCPRYL
jgi:hypothetical protein